VQLDTRGGGLGNGGDSAGLGRPARRGAMEVARRVEWRRAMTGKGNGFGHSRRWQPSGGRKRNEAGKQ
jgi:hypothetical protein